MVEGRHYLSTGAETATFGSHESSTAEWRDVCLDSVGGSIAPPLDEHSAQVMAKLEKATRQPIDAIQTLTDEDINPIELLRCPTLLKQLRSLRFIDFSSCKLTDVASPLYNAKQTDKSGVLTNLSLVPNLKNLVLSGCGLTTARFLSKFPRLEGVNLSCNGIYDLGDLALDCDRCVLNLVKLDISYNTLPDKESLALHRLSRALPNLDSLNVSGCPLLTTHSSTPAFQEISEHISRFCPQLRTFCERPVPRTSCRDLPPPPPNPSPPVITLPPERSLKAEALSHASFFSFRPSNSDEPSNQIEKDREVWCETTAKPLEGSESKMTSSVPPFLIVGGKTAESATSQSVSHLYVSGTIGSDRSDEKGGANAVPPKSIDLKLGQIPPYESQAVSHPCDVTRDEFHRLPTTASVTAEAKQRGSPLASDQQGGLKVYGGGVPWQGDNFETGEGIDSHSKETPPGRPSASVSIKPSAQVQPTYDARWGLHEPSVGDERPEPKRRAQLESRSSATKQIETPSQRNSILGTADLTPARNELKRWKEECLRPFQDVPIQQRPSTTSLIMESRGARIPTPTASGAASLQTPQTPIMFRSAGDMSPSHIPGRKGLDSGGSPTSVSTASTAITRRNGLPTRESLEPIRTGRMPFEPRPVYEHRNTHEAPEPSLRSPGTLRNLRLPDTTDETRVHPRRLLRDQPDASQLEAAEKRVTEPPPISLIGVRLSEESVRLAERALDEDPAVRRSRPSRSEKTAWKQNVVRYGLPEGLGELAGITSDEMNHYWSEFSTTLTWAMESQDQVEQELQQHQATMAFLRSQLLELLLKYQKMRNACLACLRRLAATEQSEVFAKLAVTLHSRCESLLDKLKLPLLETQALESGATSPLFMLVESCLNDVAVNRFGALLAALAFYDFAADAQPRVTDYTRNLLREFLTDEEGQVELEVTYRISAWEAEIGEMLKVTVPKAPENPLQGSKDISSLSSNELRLLLERIWLSHQTAASKILQVFVGYCETHQVVRETTEQIEFLRESIANLSSRLSTIARQCPDMLLDSPNALW